MSSLRGTKVDATAVAALREANAASPNEKCIIEDYPSATGAVATETRGIR